MQNKWSAPQEVSSRVWLAAVAGQVDSRTGGSEGEGRAGRVVRGCVSRFYIKDFRKLTFNILQISLKVYHL